MNTIYIFLVVIVLASWNFSPYNPPRYSRLYGNPFLVKHVQISTDLFYVNIDREFIRSRHTLFAIRFCLDVIFNRSVYSGKYF